MKSCLLLANFLVDHGPKVGENLVFTFCSFFSIEHCQSSPGGDRRVKGRHAPENSEVFIVTYLSSAL